MRELTKNLISAYSLADLFKIVWPPILVFVVHVILSRGFGAYVLFPWMDIPMHFLGGLSMAYSLFLALTSLQTQRMISHLDAPIEFILVFALVGTIAVFWEFGEFSMDQLLGTNVQISLQNTMQDLFMGITGAATMIGYKAVRRINEGVTNEV